MKVMLQTRCGCRRVIQVDEYIVNTQVDYRVPMISNIATACYFGGPSPELPQTSISERRVRFEGNYIRTLPILREQD